MQIADDEIDAYTAIGWRPGLPAAAALAEVGHGRLARVIEQHRAGYRVAIGEEEAGAEAPIEWRRPRFDPLLRAAVGDWVLLGPRRQIVNLLPRHSLLKRGAAGEHYRQQLIAANVDTVLVVSGLDGDFNPRRLERYLLLIRGSGAQPVVVLTKADRSLEGDAADPDLPARIEALRESLGTDVPVLTLNARDLASAALLTPWLGRGQTAVLVGSSGAGKSTLTNTLLGIERQATKAVRETDSRGRHTTTSRSLIRLPGGACLIDTPGMRELKLTGEEKVEDDFADVEALTGDCRFNDCRHQGEPGCAVQVAIKDGKLDPERWASYAKLRDERDQAARSLEARQAAKREDKVANKALNKRLVDKYGRR